jgi:hypothetical protein
MVDILINKNGVAVKLSVNICELKNQDIINYFESSQNKCSTFIL